MADTTPTSDGKLPIFHGLDTSIVERENIGMGEASLNFPWLIAISSQMGNSYTAALATTANVFCEPEWGFENGGPNQNWQGAGGHGAVGGISIWW